jgi:hypothetical protein
VTGGDPGGPLHIDDVDLESLILARNDVHPEGDWWFDPATGACLYHGLDDDSDVPALIGGAHVLVPRDPQPRSDIEDFLVSEEAAGIDGAVLARLDGARRGRGGLRRFREVVQRTSAADAWSRFTVRRESARAIGWLLGRGLVDEPSARTRFHDLTRGDAG